MQTVAQVRVSAGKGSFSVSLISEEPLMLRAEVVAQPEKGRANRELLSGLEEMLCCNVRLVAGATSRRKTIAADCGRESLLKSVKMQKR
ncbi:TPA: hypothetical protein HA225_04360 [Candidatus Micrarchaeota archaeon]|nr:hypothetical protein [Candidatus Micrarchaeota archaeon]